MRRFLIILIMSLSLSVFAGGQDTLAIRPVKHIVQIQLGQGRVRDTYLTPLLYSGFSFGLQHERWHAWKNHAWTSQRTIQVQAVMGSDRGDYGDDYALRAGVRYGVYWRKSLMAGRLTTLIGPYVGGEFVGNYNFKLAAGNNPADFQVSAALGASVAAVWHYSVRKKPASVMLQLQTPVMGYAFQQEYGASYYETFGLASGTENKHHFTSFGNRQDFDLRLTTDLPVSLVPWFRNCGHNVRVGVAYHIDTQDINHVVKRFSTFEGVIGWIYQSVVLSPKRTPLLTEELYEAY